MKLTDPSTLCLVVLLVATVFLLVRTRIQRADQQKRWAAEEGEERNGLSARGGLSTPPASSSPGLAEWEVQMHETARQLSAQLDAKLSLLQSLVAEADRAAARLEDALERTHPALPPGSQAESLLPLEGSLRDSPCDSEALHEEPIRSTNGSNSSRTAERTRNCEEVYQLADYGFAAAEIARRVGSPAGEVELILSLRHSE
jgi:hypothetical protein